MCDILKRTGKTPIFATTLAKGTKVTKIKAFRSVSALFCQ